MFKRMMVALGAAGMAMLGGCTDGYGYSGLGVGYGAGYYDGFGPAGYGYDGFYDGLGFGGPGFVPGYAGWYNNFYYPGSGAFVYDRYRRPFRWNDDQQRFFQNRRNVAGTRGLDRRDYRYPGGRAEYREDRREVRGNLRDFRRDRRADTQAYRADRRADRQAFRSGALPRDQFRAERRQDRQVFRQGARQDRQVLRRENRRAIRD